MNGWPCRDEKEKKKREEEKVRNGKFEIIIMDEDVDEDAHLLVANMRPLDTRMNGTRLASCVPTPK
jgi:hypothetical protein